MRPGEPLQVRPLRSADGARLGSWAGEWNVDGRTFHVTHAGTHDLSGVDFHAILKKLQRANFPPAGDRISHPVRTGPAATAEMTLGTRVLGM